MIEVNGLNTLHKAGGNTDDIINALLNITPIALKQVNDSDFNLKLTGDTAKDGFIVAGWIKKNIRYKADGYKNQNIKLCGRLIKDGFGDCKSFALLFNCIMSKNGYNTGYRFASYRKNKVPTHVYNYVLDTNGKKYIFDACSKNLKESNKHTFIKDMNINYLSEPYNDDVFLNGREERRERRRKRKEEGKGVFQKVKKIALAVPRQAFRALISLNVRGIATRLSKGMSKDPKKIEELWKKFGGKTDKLIQSINTGKGKKPLLGKGKGVNGIEIDYINELEFDYLGEPATAATLIASATAILIPFKKLLKDLGIEKTEGEDIISPDEEKDAEASGNKITDPNFKASDDENEGGKGGSGTGFKPSPLLIGGGIAAIAAIYFLTRKKGK